MQQQQQYESTLFEAHLINRVTTKSDSSAYASVNICDTS